MTTVEKNDYVLFQLLYRAFLDIRLLAWDQQDDALTRVARICDLFHNLPCAMAKSRLDGKPLDSAKLLEGLRKRFMDYDAGTWLEQRIIEIQDEMPPAGKINRARLFWSDGKVLIWRGVRWCGPRSEPVVARDICIRGDQLLIGGHAPTGG